MGMSSSQARLLTLTGRMHDIEYKAARLEAQKLQMANESSRVYSEYLEALDATKIQYKVLSTDGSIDYVDATYASMIDNGYLIKFKGEDRIAVSQETIDNYLAADGNENYFAALQTGRVTLDSTEVDGVTEIYTAEQLKNMSSTGSYRLMSDIDLSGTDWTSISSFKGTLDGNGYTISGLTNALFSTISGATITNLNLIASITSSSSATGVLANTSTGTNTISNVSTDGTITSTADTCKVGGLIGSNTGVLEISNVSSGVNIVCTGSGTIYAGGIIGSNTKSVSVEDSVYSGNITISSSDASASAGGIIGLSQNSSSSYYTIISNCSSSGTITNNSTTSGTLGDGGIIGTLWAVNGANATIANCSSSMDITSNGYAGGIIGYQQGSVTDCYSSGTIVSSTYAGGISGFINSMNGGGSSYISNCYTTSSVTGDEVAGSIVSLGGGGEITNSSSSDTGLDEIGAIITGTTNNNDDNEADTSTITCTASGASTSTTVTVDNSGADEALALFRQMQEYGYVLEDTIEYSSSGHENDTTWFTNMLNEGYLYIYKLNSSTGEYEQTSVATDTNLQEVSDESGLKKAEAKYEADMKKIDRKDTKYDTDLAALETERSALEEEIETLKTVASDNVERTFKLFS